MLLLSGLSADPVQRFQVPLDDGERVTFTLTFRPAVQMWFFDWEYGIKTSRGNRLCAHVNILRQYRNYLPFGLFVQMEDTTDPFLLSDLSTGRCKLYLLSREDVEAVEDALQS